jgi:hypothetical protein
VHQGLQGQLPGAHCRLVGLQLLQHAKGPVFVGSGWRAEAARQLPWLSYLYTFLECGEHACCNAHRAVYLPSWGLLYDCTWMHVS